MPRSNKTTEEFIHSAKLMHEDKYEYDKTEYKDNKTRVCITCTIHGDFFQIPNHHLSGRGCPRCAKNNKSNTEEFIERSKEKHDNFYNYSKVEYKNISTNVCITCPIRGHGDFYQTPHSHLQGHGCPRCGNENKRSNTEEFIERSNLIHSDKYTYDKVKYVNKRTRVCITCPVRGHGDFFQTPGNHLRGRGCHRCRSTTSKPAQLWLKSLNIPGLIYDDGINSEWNVPGTNYKADGYDSETNTIYEFHGDYWHGNPNKFNADDINPSVKCSYGELYRKTLEKKNALINLGYNYIEMWESDFNR